MDIKQYSIRSQDFKNTVENSWQGFHRENYFSDVILSCDDKQFEVHKAIIASSSPVIRDILKRDSTHYTHIHFEGVKQNHLKYLLGFIYQGEVNVDFEDFASFLKLAEDLKVKGISDENGKNFMLRNKQEPTPKIHYIPAQFTDMKAENQQIENITSNCKNVEDHSKASTKKDNNEQIINFELNETIFLSNVDKAASPIPKEYSIKDESRNNIQNYENNETHLSFGKNEIHGMKRSPESNKNVSSNKCNETVSSMPKNSKQEHNLQEITSSKSRAIFSCDECGNKFLTQQGLQKHVNAGHEGEGYSCEKCNYKPARKNDLKRHFYSVHAGIRYSCDLCAYKVTNKNRLIVHIQKFHGNS